MSKPKTKPATISPVARELNRYNRNEHELRRYREQRLALAAQSIEARETFEICEMMSRGKVWDLMEIPSQSIDDLLIKLCFAFHRSAPSWRADEPLDRNCFNGENYEELWTLYNVARDARRLAPQIKIVDGLAGLPEKAPTAPAPVAGTPSSDRATSAKVSDYFNIENICLRLDNLTALIGTLAEGAEKIPDTEQIGRALYYVLDALVGDAANLRQEHRRLVNLARAGAA